MNLIVRPARIEDYSAVEAIMEQVQAMHVEMRSDIYRPVEIAMSKEYYREEIANERLFVAEVDGQVAGVLSVLYKHVDNLMQVTRDVVFAEAIAVDGKWRGKGIGRAIIDHLRVIKAEKGLNGIELRVNARNADALAMYEHCGFTPKSINLELLEP